MPIGYGKTYYDARFNWKFMTEPVPGLGGRASYWPRGKLLGGSSSINAMVYIRGQHEDFDDWAALGNPGLGLGRRRRRCSGGWRTPPPGPTTGAGSAGRSTSPTCAAQVHPLCETWLAACEAAGLARNPDFNGAGQEGVGIYQITTRRGVRASAATAYLRPAMRRREPEGRDAGAGDAGALRGAAGGRGRLPARRGRGAARRRAAR